MVAKPPLPDGYDLPARVNDWVHDPDSNRNGHVWTAADPAVKRSVGVFCHLDAARVAVFDDRVDGFCNKVEPVRRDLADIGAVDASEARDPQAVKADAAAWAVDRAGAWMEWHAAAEWDHPDVTEAVFDAPPGYVLDRYFLESREVIVAYRRDDADSDVYMGQRPPETEPCIETRPYLVVHEWRGSGNASVALAPWLRAHDHQMHDVADLPDECGLEIALKYAREYVREELGGGRDDPAVGQTDLGEWSA